MKKTENGFEYDQNEILYSTSKELIRITAVGENAIRFQAFPDKKIINTDYTLMPSQKKCKIYEDRNCIFMECGTLSIQLERCGKVTYRINGDALIEEKPELTFEDGYRFYTHLGEGNYKARVTFFPHENEHFFGLGHSWDNEFDQKGCTIDIKNVNGKCTIPYVYSSLGYAILWNNPSTGLVELGKNRTRFSSDCTSAIDYVIIAGEPKQACTVLSDLTGYAPKMPSWATGFWQCRLRYETQDELLSVARRYKKMGIPVSVIIADYFHWTEQGDYKFDPKYWPNVRAMTDELHEMETRLVVSVWPTINEKSENYDYMLKNDMLIKTVNGNNRIFNFYGPQAEIDVTNPKTREFVWSKLKENYVDNGIDQLWFDEAEPEIHPEHFDNLILHAGRGDKVGLLYPFYYSKLPYDGFKAMGRDDIITLTRCAYLGAQRFGALVWSGDIPSTFESLQHQIYAAQNMAMCGIPWWNTDIGGFYGADIRSEYFKELILRWFQFGIFCPVMRLHGSRCRHFEPHDIIEPSGDPNEIWSFGEENTQILKGYILLREKLRPYIQEQMDIASNKGYPIIRPMFFHYPNDEKCFELGDQYMFGEDIIFAPIFKQGQTQREVYLPDDNWVYIADKKQYKKGTHILNAEKEEFIAFTRINSRVSKVFE